MLCLSRSIGQKIMIGDGIEIMVVDIGRGKAKLGITAPKEVPVHRREVYDTIHSQDGTPVEAAALAELRERERP